MDELKTSTNMASFEQKDPLVVYKMESYDLFEELISRINEKTTSYLAKGDLQIAQPTDIREARAPRRVLTAPTRANRSSSSPAAAAEAAARRAAEAASKPEKVETFQRDSAKIGRNDPCPCGSGKKFKHCHGR
jgi:preprotein translocase subunit SecA